MNVCSTSDSAGHAAPPPGGGAPWPPAPPAAPAQRPWAQQSTSYASAVTGQPPASQPAAPPSLAPICPPVAISPKASKPQPSLVIRPQMSKTATAAAKVAAELTAKAQQSSTGKSVPAYVKVAQAGIGAQQPAAPTQPKGWPPSLSSYVSRSFMRCKSVQDRKAIEVGCVPCHPGRFASHIGLRQTGHL